LAKAMLHIESRKVVNGNGKPLARRLAVYAMRAKTANSEGRARGLIGAPRTALQYEARSEAGTTVGAAGSLLWLLSDADSVIGAST
jgi:hypothetical protein